MKFEFGALEVLEQLILKVVEEFLLIQECVKRNEDLL